MKLIRQLVGALALCGTAFFTNIAYAGDCGGWAFGGYWSAPANVGVGAPTVAGGPVGPPAPPDGPGTSIWIDTAEWHSAPCPPENPPTDNITVVVDEAVVRAAYQNGIRTQARFCKGATQTCDAWHNQRRANPCSTEAPIYQTYCTQEVGKEYLDNSCSTVSTCSN